MLRPSLAAVAAIALAGCGARSSLFEPLGATATTASSSSAGGAGGQDTGGQGAGGHATGGGGQKPVVCGDGVLDHGEECDLGPENRDALALTVSQGAWSAEALPIDRVGDVVLFYTYQDGSSHTLLEVVNESRAYLYRDKSTGVLSLVLNHGIDQITSGEDQPEGRVSMSIAGVPAEAFVAVTDDDPTEFGRDSTDSAFGNWHFIHSTDGGVLSALPFPGDWTIRIDAKLAQGISTWSWVGPDEQRSPLAFDGTLVISARSTRSPCRTDCTLPVCGDGRVDAGEVCDDGNTNGGDGCAADCKSLD
jgi:cysteine-rich repeat protein